ncbi:amino acid permease [Limnoglobus roseus]|uniref:Amino acid permease n=1 Tax=Limnoglobus roseus TaxID=2598579 RepID=A0A5C1A7P0_9BACT|nr:amino acid permease [Limnoglobus roseus]QEL15319.1 amino acid permease [Limnoglobus roseus]
MSAESDDVRTLHKMGYAQELSRCLNGFSNFAISLSIICILAGGITSFHVGYCSVGGAAIGLGWPLVCLFSLCVAATMGQIASAFPTAGGLYHWAAILGGRGWGWGTACFNLLGLVTVLAAINVGTVEFGFAAFSPAFELDAATKLVVVVVMTATQALVNHLGIRVTRVLTDFSGYWIVLVSIVLTVSLLATAPSFDLSRLWTFTNFSGTPTGGDPVWPPTQSLTWLFALGFLLPAYTVTGFDASAHAAEETVDASRNVPKGIVRSVLVSGAFGWLMLAAIVLSMREPAAAAERGSRIVPLAIGDALPGTLTTLLLGGIAVAQYLCGLATITSASRVAFAFARDGGLPASKWVRRVSPRFRTPAFAIWLVAGASVLFTVYSPVYSTITAVCVIFLYISYVLPTVIGLFAYGRWWTEMGPWTLGAWFRPLAVVSALGCVGLIVIGMQPPNDKAVIVVGVTTAALAGFWFAAARSKFPGPPHGVMTMQQREAIRHAEEVVHEPSVEAPA